MDFIATTILPYIFVYKYLAIFIVTLIAAFTFPIPPGTLLMASAALASQGYLSFLGVVFFGSLGNIVGDNMGYWLARAYGRRVLVKIGFGKVIESDKYKKIEDHLNRKPGFIIFISRFEVFANLAVNLMCGIGKINYKKYITFVTIGEISQVLLYSTIGYIVGESWQEVNTIVGKVLFSIIIVFILFVAIFWRKIWDKK